jgi:hypothetical protein
MTLVLLALTLAAVAVLSLGCWFVFLRHRKSRLVSALLGPRHPKLAAPVVLPFLPPEKRPTLVAGEHSNLARVSGLTHREAEDLLDWLEQNGYKEGALECADDLFAVQFRVDARHPNPSAPHVARAEPERKSSVGS